ncbi:hypothetical protein JG687_00007914, partial [Phytophthora cactorum]
LISSPNSLVTLNQLLVIPAFAHSAGDHFDSGLKRYNDSSGTHHIKQSTSVSRRQRRFSTGPSSVFLVGSYGALGHPIKYVLYGAKQSASSLSSDWMVTPSKYRTSILVHSETLHPAHHFIIHSDQRRPGCAHLKRYWVPARRSVCVK